MSQHLTVTLNAEQRQHLDSLIRKGNAPARVQTRARILLLADRSQGEQRTQKQIAEATLVGSPTVCQVCRRFAHEGMDAALSEKPRPGAVPKITGAVEAHLCLLACSDPPIGYANWTLRLLRENLIELGLVESITEAALCQRLKKNAIKPWQVKTWCIGQPSARYVAKMEDVLEVYARPYDPKRPVVCLDEGAKELRSTPRGTLPCEPEQPLRQDYEYARHGKVNLFVAVEPLAGWRSVRVTQRHTGIDFAEELRFLIDVVYHQAEQVVLVTDNLNIHHPACLYEAFPPAEAHRIAQKIEWHYTPEHGSWLNIAEIELSVLHRQCLDRRLEDAAAVEREASAWEADRNAAKVKVCWQFTAADARVKLRRLYPVLK